MSHSSLKLWISEIWTRFLLKLFKMFTKLFYKLFYAHCKFSSIFGASSVEFNPKNRTCYVSQSVLKRNIGSIRFFVVVSILACTKTLQIFLTSRSGNENGYGHFHICYILSFVCVIIAIALVFVYQHRYDIANRLTNIVQYPAEFQSKQQSDDSFLNSNFMHFLIF